MARKRGRRGRHGGAEEESSERWLLTYADMITLLMALFMVLFSISSVNISKIQALQLSLRAAFSGNILPGGKSIAKPGASSSSSRAPSSLDVQAIVPVTAQSESTLQSTARGSASAAAQSQMAANQEASLFIHIKHQIDAYAAVHGFSKTVQTSIEPQGLVIRVLTDGLLFASAQASLNGKADGLLSEISQLLNVDETHPIEVGGNTDSVPIHSAVFPSNWELSTARASTVVRFLVERGVSAHRLTAAGFADQRPVAGDATAAGRARNRRVEILMRRIAGG
jgi:chemotaxis protein MotB